MPTVADLLAVEHRYGHDPTARDQHAREDLGLSPTRYAQALLRAIETQEAEALDPVLVHRLRRQVRARQQARSSRHLTG